MIEETTYANGEDTTYRMVRSAQTECIGEMHSLHGVEGRIIRPMSLSILERSKLRCPPLDLERPDGQQCTCRR